MLPRMARLLPLIRLAADLVVVATLLTRPLPSRRRPAAVTLPAPSLVPVQPLRAASRDFACDPARGDLGGHRLVPLR